MIIVDYSILIMLLLVIITCFDANTTYRGPHNNNSLFSNQLLSWLCMPAVRETLKQSRLGDLTTNQNNIVVYCMTFLHVYARLHKLKEAVETIACCVEVCQLSP